MIRTLVWMLLLGGLGDWAAHAQTNPSSETSTTGRVETPPGTDVASPPPSPPAENQGSTASPEQNEIGTLDDDQLASHFERAAALARNGASDEAKKLFQALIVINPNLVEAYLNLAVLLSAEGQFEHSADALESALNVHPVCRAITELQFTDRLFRDQPPACREVPASSTATSTPTGNDGIVELLQTIEAWRLAWQDRKIDEYLGFYGVGFEPPEEMNRREWEESRRSRLTAAQSISLDLSIRRIEIESPGSAIVHFRQAYASANFRDTVDKELRFGRSDGTWSIVAERSSPLSSDSDSSNRP